MSQTATPRLEILATLCLMGGGEEGKALFDFTPPGDQETLKAMAERLTREGKLTKKNLLSRLQDLMKAKARSALEEAHPGWILERLEDESPRLLGLFSKLLPREKARSLLECLPPEAGGRGSQVPKGYESFHVAPEVTEIVRYFFEKKFPFSEKPGSGGAFSFSHMVLIKTDDLRTLFRDLGLEEVCYAFYEVEPPVLRAFLARFSPQEAAEVRKRIEYGGNVSRSRKTEAQKHLASLTLEQLPTEGLMREVGYSVFARALTAPDLISSEQICQKLSPEEGYRLKRTVHETVAKNAGLGKDKIKIRQEEILNRLFSLAQRGLIRRYWKNDPRSNDLDITTLLEVE